MVTQDDHVDVTISDDATGMDAVTLEQLFDPFYTTKEVGKGTGLGLSIIHGIVQEFSGSVTVKSVLNEGSQFVLCFPLYIEENP
ncbi:hypothetical protein TYM08_P3227 [Marinicellulosiphila megalodicopiae]